MEQCRITAIANQKGGVGKTVTTFNLGVGLARAGQRVLLVDADPQGSLTISMGIKTPDDLDVTITSLMQATVDDRLPPDGLGIIHSEEGVDLIPANIELAAFDVRLTSVLSREYVLRQTLEPLREQYDRILIDCMPSFGMTTINALTAADSVIIPSQPSYLSTKGLAQLMGTIAKVRRQLNPKLEIDGVLLTMVDNRTNNAKAIIPHKAYYSANHPVKQKNGCVISCKSQAYYLNRKSLLLDKWFSCVNTAKRTPAQFETESALSFAAIFSVRSWRLFSYCSFEMARFSRKVANSSFCF